MKLIKREDYDINKYYLFMYDDHNGNPHREVLFGYTYDEVIDLINETEGTDKDVMLLKDAFILGMGVPNGDIYNPETDSFED